MWVGNAGSPPVTCFLNNTIEIVLVFQSALTYFEYSVVL